MIAVQEELRLEQNKLGQNVELPGADHQHNRKPLSFPQQLGGRFHVSAVTGRQQCRAARRSSQSNCLNLFSMETRPDRPAQQYCGTKEEGGPHHIVRHTVQYSEIVRFDCESSRLLSCPSCTARGPGLGSLNLCCSQLHCGRY